jgi:gamma-glutamyltranspeptidase/glutathione hydrolase
VDAEGGAVAITFTLNGAFGTHIVAPGTGVLLNNEMDDFAAKPGEPNQFGLRQGVRNAIVPGHRMLSSMSPTLVLHEGRVVLALGSPGGPRILSAVAQVIVSHIGDGRSLETSVLAPRVHHQHLPDTLFYERALVPRPTGLADLLLGREKLDALEALGHELEATPGRIGRITAIAIDPETGVATGVVDPRSYGRPAGVR